MRYLIHGLSIGILFIINSAAHSLEFPEGEWELEVKYNISGMPIANPPELHRECFSVEDPIPTSFLRARSCDIIDKRVRHRTVYYRINCFTEHGSVINQGKIRFGSFKITGSSTTELGDVAGKRSTLRYKFTGRRIGECQ